MRELTPTDVARRPLPGTVAPTSIAFSPDGATLTYLLATDGTLEQRLVSVDVATGEVTEVAAPGATVDEADLPLQEQLRRERARELAVGVTRYAWARRARRVLIPMADGLWILDDLDGDRRRVTTPDELGGPLLDARLTADGSLVGFVSGRDVYVVSAAGGPPVAVTAGDPGRTRGLAEYIAQEEMHRPHGFWFSDDGSLVAFCEVDETHIPIYRIVHQGSETVGPGAQEDHAYPFAGEANAHVRVGVVPTDGSGATDPVWLDLGCTGIGDDRYVARIDWDRSGSLLVQMMDREQSRLDLVRFDPETGAGTLLLSEASDVWINLHDHLRPLDDGSFLWASERTGFCHLEHRGADGGLIATLTSGEWMVTSIAAVDAGHVWFVATLDSPLERHLFRVSLAEPGPPERLTSGTGVHTVTFHAGTGTWTDTRSTPTQPPVTALHRVDGSATVLHDAGAADPRVGELGLTPPAELTIAADDGTPLDGLLFAPDGDGPHPLVIWLYGGPGAQLVTRSWSGTVALRAQYLCQRGFAVAVIDNRGMANRGLAFEGALRRRMGTVEVADQVALVHHLVDAGIADPGRVGVYGWSYGGYLSLMCLARRPDVFAAACAGAPVTSWDGYDTCYTERYMGTPASNPDGYRDGSVMAHVEGLRDRALLLVHGLIDENVHFRHTARLLNALLAADIDHRLLLYPDERHLPRHERDRVSMEHRIADFFRDALA